MDNYSLIILLTLVGFLGLAFLLLAPVYRFLKREERISKQWTQEELAKRMRDESASSNCSSPENEDATP